VKNIKHKLLNKSQKLLMLRITLKKERDRISELLTKDNPMEERLIESFPRSILFKPMLMFKILYWLLKVKHQKELRILAI